MSFVIVIEPGKKPYLSGGDSIKIIQEKIGMLRDQFQINKDVCLVIDDHACCSKEELDQMGKELIYNFLWAESPWGPLTFSGTVIVTHPNDNGFEKDKAEELLSMFQKLKR